MTGQSGFAGSNPLYVTIPQRAADFHWFTYNQTAHVATRSPAEVGEPVVSSFRFLKPRLSFLPIVRSLAFLALFDSLIAAGPALAESPPGLRVSHHQHLVSPATSRLWGGETAPFDAAALIAQLDEAGIERAVVLSVAYTYGDERKRVENEHERVREENDWTAAQVARWPQRLIGFCSVAPLSSYALVEIERCTQLPNMNGLKLHLGNGGVSLRNPQHAARLAEVFRAANARRTPIVVHMRARTGTPYGAEDAAIFLNQVLPAAPDSVVQIAHLAGAGPGYPDHADAAFGALAYAVSMGDARTRNLYFDVTTIATARTTPENGALIARRIREVGIGRILFGADLSSGGNPPPRESWAIFREKIPLTDTEFAAIATNIAPYVNVRHRGSL